MNQCYLLNAIPGGLVPADGITLQVIPCSADRVGRKLRSGEALSAVGHADTAALIASLTGAPCPAARISVPVMAPGDHHLLALYQGPRLPEGATTLPEGATVNFFELFADE